MNVKSQTLDSPTRRPRASARAMVILAMAMALLVQVAPPGGNPTAAAQQDDKAHSERAETEAEAYAEFVGVTVEEAERRIKLRAQMSPLVERLAAEAQDVYVGFSNVMEPTYGFEVFLKGKGSPLANELLGEARASGLPITIVTGFERSLVEVREQQQLIHRALSNAGFRDIGSAIEDRTGQVLVTVGGAAETAEARLRLPREAKASNVEITFTNSVAFDREVLRGGAETTDSCTTGFGVRTFSGSSTGIVTAGHCDNNNVNYLIGNIPLNFELEYRGYFGDFQYMTNANHSGVNEIFNPVITDITSVSGAFDFARWDVSCLFGTVSGYNCNFVWYPWAAGTDPDGIYIGTMVGGYWDLGLPGDSGGPWHNSSKAHGLHTGDIPIDGAARDVFSRAAYMATTLGVEVLTN